VTLFNMVFSTRTTPRSTIPADQCRADRAVGDHATDAGRRALDAGLRPRLFRRRDRGGGHYVTARFGGKGASLTAGDIAKLREQVSQ
jgi:hypothetical protein